MSFGTFIEPDRAIENSNNPAEDLGIKIHSGYQATAESGQFEGQNRIFDNIIKKSKSVQFKYEDQCSARYYFDVVRALRDFNGEFNRLTEVGVFMGGSSSVFAGCMDEFDFDLDMVDVSADYLRFSYERVRRMYPGAATRIRLFHGDLPSYVKNVMRQEALHKYIIHHDGAHDFNQVVRDMASLYYAQEQLVAIIAQDTHLRGTIDHMNFVDMALYAVFGLDLNYAPIGTQYRATDSRVNPNKYQGNYFLPETPEGFVLPMALNNFRYPHPFLPMEDFLGKRNGQ